MKNILRKIFVFMLAFASLESAAQDKQDVAAIKSLCGCHEVSFEFGETFSPKKFGGSTRIPVLDLHPFNVGIARGQGRRSQFTINTFKWTRPSLGK